MWATFWATLWATFSNTPSVHYSCRVEGVSLFWATLLSLFPALLKIFTSNKGIKANNRESRGKNRCPLCPMWRNRSGGKALWASRICCPNRCPNRCPKKEVSSEMYLIAKCRHYRISEVYRGDKVKYVIHRRRLGWLWLRQWVPSIYFDFPVNWLRSVSVFDTVDDAQDALYSHLWLRHPSSDYTLHVWQSRWLRG